jgi:hypothetical protein
MKVALQHGRLSPDAAPDGPDEDLYNVANPIVTGLSPSRALLPRKKTAVSRATTSAEAEAFEESEAYAPLPDGATLCPEASFGMLEGLGGAPDDEGELLQMREQHAEEARDAFALQTTKSWQEVRYWLVRPAWLMHKQIPEDAHPHPPSISRHDVMLFLAPFAPASNLSSARAS